MTAVWLAIVLLAAPLDGGVPAPVVPALQRIASASAALERATTDEARAQAALDLQHAADAWAGLLSQNKVLREKQAAESYVAGFNAQKYGVTLRWCPRTRFFRSGGEGFTQYLKLAPRGAARAEAERFLAQSPQFCPAP